MQYNASSAVAKDYYQFSNSIHELHVGFKKLFADGTQLEVALTENLFVFNNSADVGVHVGISGFL